MAFPRTLWLLSGVFGLSTALGCGGAPSSGPVNAEVGQGPTNTPDEATVPAIEVAGPEGPSSPDRSVSAPQRDGAAGKEAAARPKGLLGRADAEQYVLKIVNRDRAAQGLPPVRWDPTAAKAGQRHANDMAKLGFTGHTGSDASVPETRYTDAGGQGLVMENAGCFGDATARELDPDPRFTPESLERVQKQFMDEVPPADGHRRNILMPRHTAFGVGLAKVKGIDEVACMAQEFVDDYGRYDPLPARAKIGDTIRIAGEVRAPATFAGVGLSRVDPGKPRTPKELLAMGGYPIPAPYATYFPRGFKTPKPVEVTGNRFEIQLPLDDKGRAGRYGVSVWATFPGSKELVMISLRTITVEKK
ncbi:CAP domain-containing protein [Chondromyces crocatus]|uniref:SCP domain-containing protein n=1 Tax=Chondromyces crocatus TaxID=52 RepID=A0A0K1EI12_CHOCO|nr:CAP domain-containing protein [Chondromyces crocatus]AKT40322.1 uncharacterized protein CMC5_044750 [Chondromyces crocatus]